MNTQCKDCFHFDRAEGICVIKTTYGTHPGSADTCPEHKDYRLYEGKKTSILGRRGD